MNKIIVSPSILSADFVNLERDIKIVENCGADWIHIDVMDGHFVPNITIGVPVVKSIRKITNLPLDVHLMIQNPQNYIESFANAGADIITFHYEAIQADNDDEILNKCVRLINKIKSFNIKAGISIKPLTQPDKILPLLDEVDMILIMTVEPGFGGQKFISECAKKIELIKKHAQDKLIIQVDGGINELTAKIARKYGANSLVAGNYIYKSNNIAQAIMALKQ